MVLQHSVCLCVCLSVCLCACVSVCAPVCLHVCPGSLNAFFWEKWAPNFKFSWYFFTTLKCLENFYPLEVYQRSVNLISKRCEFNFKVVWIFWTLSSKAAWSAKWVQLTWDKIKCWQLDLVYKSLEILQQQYSYTTGYGYRCHAARVRSKGSQLAYSVGSRLDCVCARIVPSQVKYKEKNGMSWGWKIMLPYCQHAT